MILDAPLQLILAHEAVDTEPLSSVRRADALLLSVIQKWAGGLLSSTKLSRSFTKRASNSNGTDIELHREHQLQNVAEVDGLNDSKSDPSNAEVRDA